MRVEGRVLIRGRQAHKPSYHLDSLGVLFAVWMLSFGAIAAGEWSGYLATEARLFQHDPADARQAGNSLSFAFQPEYYKEWDKGYQSFTFVPFIRVDGVDSERSHFDIRELTWLKAERDWELRLGMRRVFWGVTESRHLVDIINQTDLVENLDGEDKLGQPMLNLALIRDWGTLDFYVLPGFRERTFAGAKGRFRSALTVDTDQTRYTSAAGDKRIDWAVRWSHSIDDWEFGLSHFSGTNRDPQLVLGLKGVQPVLIPVYHTIDQTSLDTQLIVEDWLWKLELALRNGEPEGSYVAAVGGFEYTIVGIADTDFDLGVIGEYLFDDRFEAAPQPFQNDVLVGFRLTANDAQSSELLFGMIQDLDGGGRSFNLEASRRLGDSMKLSVEWRIFSDTDRADPLNVFADDDHVQAELAWYF